MRHGLTKVEKVQRALFKPAGIAAHNRRHIVVTDQASRGLIDLFREALDRGNPETHNRGAGQ